MTESHFIWGQTDSKWQRAFEFRGVNKVKKKTTKGPVFAVELDTDDYVTLRGGIKAATFGNCLIVEPRRQGYTQDFRFKIDQALHSVVQCVAVYCSLWQCVAVCCSVCLLICD